MLGTLALILCATVVVSCAITPAIFSFLLALVPTFPWPYSRVFDRVVLAVAVLLILVFRKRLRISIPNWRTWSVSGESLSFLGTGLAFSLLASAGALYASVFFDRLTWADPTMEQIFSRGSKGFLTAAVVSLLEETLFRGILYGRLAAQFGHWIAAVSSSLLYAVVHFIAPDKKFLYPGWSPTVGFEYMWSILGRLGSDGVIQGIFGLFLVGLVLCEAFRRTRSLWLPIGLHAGWVLALKVSLFVTVVPAGTSFAEGLGRRYFFVAEPSTWVCVGLVWLAVRKISWRRS